jgi:hypothetical protein
MNHYRLSTALAFAVAACTALAVYAKTLPPVEARKKIGEQVAIAS